MTDNLISVQCAAPYDHLIIQSEETGASLFIFEKADAPFPERDYWFESKEEALAAAQNDYGVADWQPTSLRY